MNRVSTLLFDVMGTLVFDPFHDHVPAFFSLTFEQLLEQKHPTAWKEFERGTIDEPTFFPKFFRDGRSFDTNAFKAMMKKHYAWIDGMETLVSELFHTGVPMHALSNYPPWYSMIEQRTGLSRFVAWSFVSCHTGFRKPDPKAYLHAAQELGQPMDSLLFIDDRPINCDAARSVGMQAIEFIDARQLRTELFERGLLAGREVRRRP